MQRLLFIVLLSPLPLLAADEGEQTVTVMWCNESGKVVRKKTPMTYLKAQHLFNLSKRTSGEVLLRCPSKQDASVFDYRWSSTPKQYLETHCCPKKTTTELIKKPSLTHVAAPLAQCPTRLVTKRAEPLDLLRLSAALPPKTAIVIRHSNQYKDISLRRQTVFDEERLLVPLIPYMTHKKALDVILLGANSCRLGTFEYAPLASAPRAFKTLLDLEVELVTLFVEAQGGSLADLRSNPQNLPEGAKPYAMLYVALNGSNNPKSLEQTYQRLTTNTKADAALLDALVEKSGMITAVRKIVSSFRSGAKPAPLTFLQKIQKQRLVGLLAVMEQHKTTLLSSLSAPSPSFMLAGGQLSRKGGVNRWANKISITGGACVSIGSAEDLEWLLEKQKTISLWADSGRNGKFTLDNTGVMISVLSVVFPPAELADKGLLVLQTLLDISNSLLPSKIDKLRFDVRNNTFNEDHDAIETYKNIKIQASSSTYKLSQAAASAMGALGVGKDVGSSLMNYCTRNANCGADDIKNQPAIGPCLYKNVPLSYDFIKAHSGNGVLAANNKGEFRIMKAGEGLLTLSIKASRLAGREASEGKRITAHAIAVEISPRINELREGKSAHFTATVQNAYDQGIDWEITGDDGYSLSESGKSVDFTAPEIPEDKCRVKYFVKAISTSRGGARRTGLPERFDKTSFFVKQQDDAHPACNKIIIEPMPSCLDKDQTYQFEVRGEGEKIDPSPAVVWQASVGSLHNGLYTPPKKTTEKQVTISAKTTKKPIVDTKIVVDLDCRCHYELTTTGLGGLSGQHMGISPHVIRGTDIAIPLGGTFDFVSGEIINSAPLFDALKGAENETPEAIEKKVNKGFGDLIASFMTPKFIIPPITGMIDIKNKRVGHFSYDTTDNTYYGQDTMQLILEPSKDTMVIGRITGTLADANKKRFAKFEFKFRAAKGGGALCAGL